MNKKVIGIIVAIIIVIFGIKTMRDINLGAYLIGKSSFAIPTNIILSLLNNFITVISISILTYNFEKLLLKKKEGIKNGKK